MKRLDKKGFTLIELLAVIVVLAILLVIAVPRILGVVETARSELLGKSAQLAAKHLQEQHAIGLLANPSAPAAVTASTLCPPTVGFDEGVCRYTMAYDGLTTEPIYTVTLKATGKFDGWYAQSVGGAASVPTKTVIVVTPTWP